MVLASMFPYNLSSKGHLSQGLARQDSAEAAEGEAVEKPFPSEECDLVKTLWSFGGWKTLMLWFSDGV